MNLVEATGYLASLLVFVTFYMKTMVPLRVVAIGSNVAFIAYGMGEMLYPVVILHSALLPLNLLRLFQIKRLIRQVEKSADGDLDIRVLLPFMSRTRYRKGDVIFRKDAFADSMLYIAEGTVYLKEFDVSVGAGSVIGEIGLFAPDRKRTATAVCASKCNIYSITSQKIHEHYYQNPKFAFALLKLITARLIENLHGTGKNN